MCVPLHFNMYKEIGIKLDSEHWYDHVPKSVDAIHEGKGYHIMEPTSVRW